MTEQFHFNEEQDRYSTSGRYYVPKFPIGEGTTDYEKYLRTKELLSLQKPVDKMASPEELLFQVTHQAAELYMKLMMHELDRFIVFLDEGKILMAVRSMRLVNDCQRIMLAGTDAVAQHISIVEYEKIRMELGQGSGMESPGFNWLLEYPPRLWKAFQGVLQRRNANLRDIYRDYEENIELHTLAEVLMDYDDLFHKWRAHHFALVARTIGTESNSLKGLSTQVLMKGVKARFFPELMQIRSDFTNESAVAYGGQPLP